MNGIQEKILSKTVARKKKSAMKSLYPFPNIELHTSRLPATIRPNRAEEVDTARPRHLIQIAASSFERFWDSGNEVAPHGIGDMPNGEPAIDSTTLGLVVVVVVLICVRGL